MENRLTIRPTSRCNLNCTYCMVEKNDRMLKVEDVSEIVKFIDEHDITNIFLTGGEPFINWQVIQILIEQTNCYINIITNGTILNDDILKILASNRVAITLSLDGDIYSHNLNRSNSFLKLMANLDSFKPYINDINVVVTRNNIYELHNSLNFINTVLPNIKTNMLFDFNIDWTQVIDFNQFREYYLTKLTPNQFTSFKEHYENGICSSCGTKDYFIDEDLNIYPCSNFSTPSNIIGNIKNGINHHKQYPFQLFSTIKPGSKFECMLQNKKYNGSIFETYKKDYSFFEFVYSLITGGDYTEK